MLAPCTPARPCSEILTNDNASLANLKAAATAASKAVTLSPTNATLIAAKSSTAATYALANAALTTKMTDLAALLACFVGIFSFGIGILKVRV